MKLSGLGAWLWQMVSVGNCGDNRGQHMTQVAFIYMFIYLLLFIWYDLDICGVCQSCALVLLRRVVCPFGNGVLHEYGGDRQPGCDDLIGTRQKALLQCSERLV